MAKGWLYAARMLVPGMVDCPIKIGFTGNPEGRKKGLQHSSPFPIEWLGIWPAPHGLLDEKLIFEACAEYRLRGEWFSPHSSVLKIVQQSVEAFDAEVGRALEQGKTPTGRVPRDVAAWQSAAKGAAYQAYKQPQAEALGYLSVCSQCGSSSRDASKHARRLMRHRAMGTVYMLNP